MDTTDKKFTPGKWEFHPDDGTGTLPCVLSENVNAGGNFYVAQCNVAADAKLCAAAPELLAALELCYTRIFNFGMDSLRDPQWTQKLCNEAMDAAQAALKKAGVFQAQAKKG